LTAGRCSSAAIALLLAEQLLFAAVLAAEVLFVHIDSWEMKQCCYNSAFRSYPCINLGQLGDVAVLLKHCLQELYLHQSGTAGRCSNNAITVPSGAILASIWDSWEMKQQCYNSAFRSYTCINLGQLGDVAVML
jgi:hypothetical protein